MDVRIPVNVLADDRHTHMCQHKVHGAPMHQQSKGLWFVLRLKPTQPRQYLFDGGFYS